MTSNLEKLTKRKQEISPEVERVIQSMVGVTIPQISEDISNRLVSGNLGFDVDLSKGFKKAKEEFKRDFLIQLLNHTNGNIAEAARIADTDRRTIHRLITRFKVDVHFAREMPLKFTEDKKIEYVQDVVKDILESYDITRGRYTLDEETTKKISDKMPHFRLTFDEAVDLFEKEFIKKALEKFKSQKEAAKRVGLRYETLHKKAKEFGLV